MVYVGCAGKPEPAPHPVIPKPEERLHREPEIPEPPPEEPAPFEPVHSVEMPLAMEVLELGFVELPEGAHLLVLGRRALSLVQVGRVGTACRYQPRRPSTTSASQPSGRAYSRATASSK